MASPEKTIVAIACKDGKVNLQVKHKTRGIVGEAELGTGTGTWQLEFPGIPTIIQTSGASTKPKSSKPAKKTGTTATKKSAASSAKPAEEVKPEDDFVPLGLDGEGGL